jgi:integrase/recombinase XerD
MDKWLNYGRAQYAKSEQSDYLICTSYSTQVQDKYANEIVKRVADRAGLLTAYTTDAAGRDLHHPTAHSYRHSFAVHRLSMNLKPLSDLLGHQSTDTTAEQYLHLRDKDLKKINDEHRPKF